jgi:hypothetical protein
MIYLQNLNRMSEAKTVMDMKMQSVAQGLPQDTTTIEPRLLNRILIRGGDHSDLFKSSVISDSSSDLPFRNAR